jgi:hypothetical protein
MKFRISDYAPYIQTANIRGKLEGYSITIGEGIGKEGDIVLTQMLSNQESQEVIDYEHKVLLLQSPSKILGVLGNRESSTHVNGGITKEGILIKKNSAIDWIGGKSGIIGRTYREGEKNKFLEVENSCNLMAIGLLQKDGENLNINEFAIKVKATKLSTPIIFIAATSAEAGKTVLTCKIIEILAGKGKKVAAIKTTGSGGVMDCIQYRKAGAAIVLDQVDCGLITTYTGVDKFKKYIINAYLYAQERKADVIVAEMGGDLIWANNPTLLTMDQIIKNLKGLLVINNDALSLLGTQHFINNHLNGNLPLYYFASPFRNFFGMEKRVSKIAQTPLYDPNNIEMIDTLLNQLI